MAIPRKSIPAIALPGRQVFLYVVNGDVEVRGEPVQPHHLIEVDRDGESLEIEASSDACLLFGHGDVIDEPVVSHGPFVMNTVKRLLRRSRIIKTVNLAG